MPTNLRLMRGNPGRRPIPNEPKPEIPARPPEPPEFLDDYAAEEFRRVSVELWRLRLLTAVDVQMLAGYAYSFSQWRTAAETLRRLGENDPVMHGQLVKSGEAGGASPNPLLWVARVAFAIWRAMRLSSVFLLRAGWGLRRATIHGRGVLTVCWRVDANG